jgi:SAM-dependent methyltransferase
MDAKELYKDYWVDVDAAREKRAYYDRLYARVVDRLRVPESARVLDVAGGNGQFLSYLGRKSGDVLDISESGLKAARAKGFRTIECDVERRFPVEEGSYDAAYCFEVLEHLWRPNKTLSEIHHALKPGGVLFIGQPNMRADGSHHVRRYYKKPLVDDLEKCGFAVEWIDYVPAYSMREAILDDIRNNPNPLRKAVQCVNLGLSLLPRSARYAMARAVPDRFALLFILKAVKKA